MLHILWLHSYVWDTFNIFDDIKEIQIPLGSLLVAIDIKALYSSTHHKQGVRTVRSFLKEQDHTTSALNKFVLKLLWLILTILVFMET